MNASFYTAARGAMTQQDRMNVISNNLANVNTIGFKAKNAVFSDLMHCVMHGQENVTHGTGVKLERTTTDFTSGGMTAAAEGGYNYYIDGDGFFMLKDQITGEISYTRAGNFSLSVKGDEINLINDNRKQVLDENKNPIQLKDGKLSAKPGIFSFQNTEDMQAAGFSEYTPIAKMDSRSSQRASDWSKTIWSFPM